MQRTRSSLFRLALVAVFAAAVGCAAETQHDPGSDLNRSLATGDR